MLPETDVAGMWNEGKYKFSVVCIWKCVSQQKFYLWKFVYWILCKQEQGFFLGGGAGGGILAFLKIF